MQRILSESAKAVPRSHYSKSTKQPDPLQSGDYYPVFEAGGVIAICGGFGLGKVELLEYTAHVALRKFSMYPLMCNSASRPGEGKRAPGEFLKCILASYRNLDKSLPPAGDSAKDMECLNRICPEAYKKVLPRLPAVLGWEEDTSEGADLLGYEIHKEEIEEIINMMHVGTGMDGYKKN